MSERLYQPDFSCIFGEKYQNAFLYGKVDSLVWPMFEGLNFSLKLEKMLNLQNLHARPYFYRRKISIQDEIVELDASGIDIALLQAMDLNREYGIENKDVLEAVKQDPELFKGIISFNLVDDKDSEEIIKEIKKISEEIPIAGIVIYPSYTKLDITQKKNKKIEELLEFCKDHDLLLKIDVGNQFLPKNHPDYTSVNKIKEFLSYHQENTIIISGVDIEGDVDQYYQLLKYYNNVWLEIDPRSFGSMTPTDCFRHIFGLKGFIQNSWHRITIGSATPTLECSQMARGFEESTEILPFAQKCLLRSWVFRNINRLNSNVFTTISKKLPSDFKKIISITEEKPIENAAEFVYSFKIKLRSYSVTQLLFITDLINDLFSRTSKGQTEIQQGEMLIRSYHTTTSLILNEHEYGNYLDLHYKFAEISKQDSSGFLHTVRALENRADFNHYDHELASTYGNRQLIIPILNGKLEIGGRENFYILVTFGPRTFNLFVRIKVFKLS